jgi:glycogen debranching enzyme
MSADPQRFPHEEAVQPFYIAAHDSLVDEPPRTLKHGDTFALFDHYGDLASRRGNTLGLYHNDTRFLSRLKLTIEQRSPLLLSSTVRTNHAVLDVDLTNPDVHQGDTLLLAKDTIHVTRMKYLWNAACYELVAFRNFGDEARRLRVDFEFDADFADLFEVRGFKRAARGRVTASVLGADTIRFDYASQDGVPRCTDIHFDPPPRELQPRHARLELDLAPKQRRSIAVSVHCRVAGAPAQRGALRALRQARRDLRGATRRTASVSTSSSLVNEILGWPTSACW